MRRLVVAMSILPFLLGADAVPLPEHPRPDFRRDAWVNLNGAWQFAFDAEDVGQKEGWFDKGRHTFSKRITVPFPWEAKLSGIGDTEYRGVAWYAREITIPKDWKEKNAWLVFGAVDFEATVWANGWLVGKHVGGYAPFAVNLSGVARPGNSVFVVVRVKDVTDPHQPTGKQVRWYTRTSGIWQTVYLEGRGAGYIQRVHISPSLAKKQAAFAVETSGRGSVVVETAGQVQSVDTGREGNAELTITIPEPRAWHPDDPHLYDATVTLKNADDEVVDQVHTYFGLRDIGVVEAPAGGYKYITLNGKPIYLRGALHQSFHPDGIYQYPTDKLLRWDYEYAKRIGLNFLRIHIKAEIPRALYWADKLGVLIMEDMPNPWEHSDQARVWYEAMLREVVDRDFNHPSILAWCDFNETWGLGSHRDYKKNRDMQAWVRKMYELTKQLDPTRLVEDNSPCHYDHVVTDINSWHFYINDYQRARDHIANVVEQTKPGSGFNYCPGLTQTDAPLINSEYGGISAGSGDQDISWCFKYLTNELRLHEKVCGYIYTEQSDIEWEHNGFLNYDRTEKEYGYDYWFPGFGLADLNAGDFLVLDTPPCRTVKPGEKVKVPVALSHWSSREANKLTLRWQLRTHDGGAFAIAAKGEQAARWEAYRVVPQQALSVKMPDRACVASLNVEVVDGQGRRVAANYVNFHVYDKPSPRVEVLDEKTIALRMRPGDFSAWSFAGGTYPVGSGIAAEKVAGRGAGAAGYELAIPQNIPVDKLDRVTFRAELSAKAGDERLDWPARKKPVDYPQTDRERKWPSTLRVSLNGATEEQVLPDDPADGRGALSHHYRHQPGSYGYLAESSAAAGSEALEQIAKSRRIELRLEVPADAKHRGGLAVFGERLGRYPLDPTIVLAFKSPHGLDADYGSDECVAVNRVAATRQVLVPTAEEKGTEWRYTTSDPGKRWADPGFDDTKWKTGRSGFGTKGTPNAIIGTRWDTPNIWLRTKVRLPAGGEVVAAFLRMYHDEDVTVHINGRGVARRTGYVTNYIEETLDAEACGTLREGENVIAVHCRQTGGGQNIDVGLSVIRGKR